MIVYEKFSRRLSPLIFAQFFGAFNDNAFKMFVILAMFGPKVDYFENCLFLFLLTVAYVLPFILLSGPAGAFADRLPKRSILIVSKLAELIIMILGTVCFVHHEQWGFLPLFGVMFLMTMQSTFFSPAFNGILPETFPEYEISRANGSVGMVTFLAAILGAGIAPVVYAWSGHSLFRCGELLCTGSILGFIAAVLVLPSAPLSGACRNAKLSGSFLQGWKAMCAKRGLWVTAFCDAFFCSIGVFFQLVIVLFAKFEFHTELELSTLFLAPALGMAVGCLLCGILSGKHVELGFVPMGGFGLSLFLLLTGLHPGQLTELIPELHFSLHVPIHCYLFLAGVSSGFFVVPVRAYFQQWLAPARRGAALAAENLLAFACMLFSSFIFFLLVAGSAKTLSLPGWLEQIVKSLPHFAPSSLAVAGALVMFLFTVLLLFLLPDFLFRSFILIMMHTLYKMRITGSEKIPETGPALLVSNHASFVDGFIISACTSRRIRFLMHEDYYRQPLLNPLARFGGFVEVPRDTKVKSMSIMLERVKELLRKGEVVCVFPEGKITKNGIMDEFRSGFNLMLPEGMDVPIIPARIGMIFGSIFSYFYGKIKLRLPKEFPHPVTVTFGDPIPKGTSAFELRQIISELGADTEMVPRSHERPLHYQLARNAKLHPFHKIAVDLNGAQLNNFQFCIRAAVMSRKIRQMVDPECRYVGVFLPNCSGAVIACVGVMMADKVPAIMNFTATRASLVQAAEKSKITHILTSRKFLDKIHFEPLPQMVFLEDVVPTVSWIDKISVLLSFVLLPHQEFMNLLSPMTHRNVMNTAVVLFSSGSTGVPKGVMLSHHNVNSDVYACLKVASISPDDVILGNLPVFHAFGMITALWIPTMLGNKVVYVASPLDCEAISRSVIQQKVTILLGTPTFMQTYLRRCKSEVFQSLRLCITGAERLRMDISEKFDATVNGERALLEGYGCTELSPIVAINVGSSVLSVGKTVGKPGSIGPALPGICAKVVDPVTRQQLPPDTEGLLIIKGPNVMQGYLGEPGLTADAIQNGWYNTGDIAKIDLEGYIFLCGRLSRFSKIGGEMVPNELVECAINEILSLDEKVAAVASIPDPQKGEALVVLYTRLPMTPEEIIAEMRARSITNLWIPKASNFWQIDHLPMLGTGKLDLVQLKQMVFDLLEKRNASKS